MTRPVLIAHASGDEAHAAVLADSIAAAGYLVVHAGTVLIGESIVEEASRALTAGAPVVLCGTIRAMGTPWAHRMVNAARAVSPGTRVYGVAIEQDAYLQPLALDGRIADYWRDPAGALDEVVAALVRHHPPGPVPALDGAAATRRFRDLLLRHCDIIDLANLPADRRLVTQELALRNLFLPLAVRVDAGPDADQPVPSDAVGQRRSPIGRPATGGPVPATPAKAAAQSPGARLEAAHRLVVLGDPGSGKTTLLRWMATAYLLRLQGDTAWRELPGVGTLPDRDWLPILVRCRDLGPDHVDGTLADVLLHVLRRAELSATDIEAMRADLDGRLSAGTALLLVDGLDEIGDPRARTRFCELLERVHLTRPSLPIVVTSRIVGYREMGRRIGRGFEHVVIAELDARAKDDFIRRWCTVTEPPDRRASATDELIADVHGTERIERLTGTPMMLTTLALVKRSVGKLPDRRADLYDEAVRVLLSWRAEVDEPMNPREAEPQLQYLAYAMSDRGVQQLTEDEVLDLLDQMRAEYPHLRAVQRRDSGEFLRLLERRTGIVVEKGHVRRAGRLVSVFEFRHLTFQEYLTAQAMVRRHLPDPDRGESLVARTGRLAARVKDEDNSENTWQEVIRLAVSLCHGDDVDHMLRAVLAVRPVLAARCLEDEPDAGTEVVDDIVRALVQAVPAAVRWESPVVVAVLALARTAWQITLRDHLLAELRSRGPVAVPALGMVIGRALAPADGPDLPARLSALVTGLRAGGDEMLVSAFIFGMLADSGDDPVVLPADELLTLLEHPDPVVAGTSAWVMGLIQPPDGGGWWPADGDVDRMITLAPTDPAGRMTLLSLIDAAGPRRWPNAARLLGDLAGDEVTVVRAEAVRLLGYVDQEEVLPTLLSAFTDAEPDVRENAALGLVWLRSSAADPGLMAAVDDEVPEVRQAVVRAIGKLAHSTSATKLQAMLGDPVRWVRNEAAGALGNIGESASVVPLLLGLNSVDGSQPWHTVVALRDMGDDRTVPALVDSFDQLLGATRAWALLAFGEILDRRALDVLRRHLRQDAPIDQAHWAIRALGSLTDNEPSDRAAIDSALTSDNAELRKQAVWALRQIGDDTACDQLTGLARDKSGEVRAEVGQALAGLDGEIALAAAKRLATDENQAVRTAVMRSMGELATDAGFDILTNGSRDHDLVVRRQAVRSLRAYDEERAQELLIRASQDPVSEVRQWAAVALRQGSSRSPLQTLLRLTHDRDPMVRAEAFDSLGHVGGAGVLSRLVDALRRPDSYERIYAASGLADLLDDRAIEPLTTALNDPQAAVRREAATALGNLASERVLAPLISSSTDPAPMVRREVAVALGVGAVPAARPALQALLGDPHPLVRAAAVTSLGALSVSTQLDDLSPLLSDTHPVVRRNVVWTLDRDDAIEDLIRCLDDPGKEVRRAALWTLGLIGAPDAAHHMHARLDGLYGQVRATAVEALCRIEGPESLSLVTAALDDPHQAVRLVAVRQLRCARNTAPTTQLRAALFDPAAAVRAEAARTAAGLGDRAAVPIIADQLRREPASLVRMRMAGALGRLRTRDARQPLMELRDDPDYDVRETAAWALGLLGDQVPMAALRSQYAKMPALLRRSLTGMLARLGDSGAQRLMGMGLDAPSRSVRRKWAGVFNNGLPAQADRDLLIRHASGTSDEFDPHEVIDERTISRMARILWRTPDEIRAAYRRLAAEIPLRIAG